MPVQPVAGVPRWFTLLAHQLWRRTRCRNGHATVPICTRCGYTPGWTLEIVGRESGHRSELPFLEFVTFEEAATCAITLNARQQDGLTYFEPALRHPEGTS